MVHTGTVSVNGPLLRADREALALSREALAAAAQGFVSVETLRRAEAGTRVQVAKLRRIAEVLEADLDRYVISDPALAVRQDGHVINISGRWTSYWVEVFRGQPPFIAVEQLDLFQRGNRVTGAGITTVNDRARREIIENGRIDRTHFSGDTHVEGWARPNGVGMFQAIISREDDWMDGYATWNDVSTRQIEVSRIIFLRNDSPRLPEYVQEAEEQMTLALKAFEWRRRHWQ